MNSLFTSLTSSNLFRSLVYGFCGGVLLSLFIFLYHFDIRDSWTYTLLGFVAVTFYLKSDRRYRFSLGFFTGVLWFYWIPFSFRFFGLDYFIPLAIIGIGCFYGVLFYIALYLQNVFYRAVCLFCFPFIAPFGFDWFDFRIMFAPSVLDISYIGYGLILLSMVAFLYFKGAYRLTGMLVVILSLFLYPKQDDIELPTLSIQRVDTEIPQQIRWDRQYIDSIVFANFNEIDAAIVKQMDVIIFPETAFPFVLDRNPAVFERLLQYSQFITIVAGALRQEGHKTFNTSYVFHEGGVQHADKQILVPFGEYTPLPDFIKQRLDSYLGRGEFAKAEEFEPINFQIDDFIFRSAICYEATSAKMFQDDPRYMIAISNNAWFTPSTQPALQELIMLARARVARSVIFHAANGSVGAVVIPER